jgi:hypothetical protein
LSQKIDPSYWKTKDGAAFNAIGELCNPDASMNERFEAADLLRAAIGMPLKHTKKCAINRCENDEPDASDCDCGYWDEPGLPALTAASETGVGK